MVVSFHNKPELKEKYVARVLGHYEADRIKRRHYWNGNDGCALGCTLEMSGTRLDTTSNEFVSIHNTMETELGIPAWLAQMEELVFEKMRSKGDSEYTSFPYRFIRAVPVGVNLNDMQGEFLAWIREQQGDIAAQRLAMALSHASQAGGWNHAHMYAVNWFSENNISPTFVRRMGEKLIEMMEAMSVQHNLPVDTRSLEERVEELIGTPIPIAVEV